MNYFMLFNYNNQDIHVKLKDNKPWFMIVDICSVLGISDINNALNGLDDEEKDERECYSGSDKRLLLINESGLFSLIFKSNTVEALQFKKWINRDLLPLLSKEVSHKRASFRREYSKSEKASVERTESNVTTFLEQWRTGQLGVPFNVCIAGDIFYIYNQWCKKMGQLSINDTQFGIDMKKKIASSGGSSSFWYESSTRRKRRQAIVYLPNPPSDFSLSDAKRLGEYVKVFRDDAHDAGYNTDRWKRDGSWSEPSDFN